MVLDPSLPVRHGDPVMGGRSRSASFGARCLPAEAATTRSCGFPSRKRFQLVAVADILHMDRAVLVQPREGEPFEPEPVSFPTMKLEDWTPPKLANLSDAHDAALMSILGKAGESWRLRGYSARLTIYPIIHEAKYGKMTWISRDGLAQKTEIEITPQMIEVG